MAKLEDKDMLEKFAVDLGKMADAYLKNAKDPAKAAFEFVGFLIGQAGGTGYSFLKGSELAGYPIMNLEEYEEAMLDMLGDFFDPENIERVENEIVSGLIKQNPELAKKLRGG